MNYNIITNLIHCSQPTLNNLESFVLENVKKQDFNDYPFIRDKLRDVGIIVFPIGANLYFFRLKRILTISQTLNLIDSILSNQGNLIIKLSKSLKDSLNSHQLNINESLYNYLIPHILQEMLIYDLDLIFPNLIADRTKNRISMEIDNKIFIYTYYFYLDDHYTIYLSINPLSKKDLIHPNESIITSEQRYQRMKAILGIICNIDFFVAGKTLKFNPYYLTLQKNCEEKKC